MKIKKIRIKMTNIWMEKVVEWVMVKDRIMLAIKLRMRSNWKDLKIMNLIWSKKKSQKRNKIRRKMKMILKCRMILMEILKMKRKKRKKVMMNNLIQKKMMPMMHWIKLMRCLTMNFGTRICKTCRIKKTKIKMIKIKIKKIEKSI
jgi:hypothetical protein